MATESGTYTPETLARRLKMAEALMAEPNKPIEHWMQGVAQLGKSFIGGRMMRDIERQQQEGETAANKARLDLLGLGGGVPAVAGALNAGGSVAAPPQAAPAPPQVMDMGGPAQPDAQGVYGPDAVMAPPPSPGTPRGIRNNNPLNIEAGPFTQGVTGFAGSDGRFARFEKPEQGIDAAGKLLDTYSQKHGLNTVRGIIGRWAPSAEPGNNTSGYVASVAARMGVDPDQPLTPEQRPALIAAMGQFENGRPIQMPGGAVAPVAAALNAPAAPAGGGDIKTKIAAMLQNPNPYVRRQGAALADAMVQKQLLKEDPKFHRLNDEQLFDERTGRTIAAGSGFRPLVDPAERAKFGIPETDKRPYQLGPGNKLINPPPETRVNIDQKAEGAFRTKGAGLQAERFDKIVQAGFEAKTMRADLEVLKDIGSRITTGKTAEIAAALGPYAEALGVKIEGLGDLQAYQAIVSKLAPRMRPAGSGATSDFEMMNYLKALPGLGKTSAGNALIAETMEALYDHQEKAAEIASRALSEEITAREAEKLLRGLPDPMTAWRKAKAKIKDGMLADVAPTVPGAAPPAAPGQFKVLKVE